MDNIDVPVTYFKQTADTCVNIYDVSARTQLMQRQFEWSGCEYYNLAGVEIGMTEYLLDAEGLPTALGGSALTNRGVKGENFSRWYHEVSGKSSKTTGILTLEYDGANYVYENADFHPVTGLFTMMMGVEVVAQKNGREKLRITADDDTWVYVDGKLVLDLGGVHAPATAELTINENGEIYAATEYEDFAYSGVTVGEKATVKIFHANRDSGESVFKVRFEDMLLSAVLESDGAVAPLGTTMTVAANYDTVMMKAAVAEVAVVCMLAIMVIAAIVMRRELRSVRK